MIGFHLLAGNTMAGHGPNHAISPMCMGWRVFGFGEVWTWGSLIGVGDIKLKVQEKLWNSGELSFLKEYKSAIYFTATCGMTLGKSFILK
jgi:hypothetical protein